MKTYKIAVAGTGYVGLSLSVLLAQHELNNAFAGRNEVVDRLCGYPLLVIDDFGMERGTEYALEQMSL